MAPMANQIKDAIDSRKGQATRFVLQDRVATADRWRKASA